MKFCRIASVILAILMLFSFTACRKENGGDGTKAPEGSSAAPANTTAGKPESSKAPAESTAKPDNTTKKNDETTTPETDPPLAVDTISESEMTILRMAMPQKLPDNSDFSILTRMMCGDNAEDYQVGGNSKGSLKYVDETEGAVYGKAFRFAGKADEKDSRGEIQINPQNVNMVTGARGILFYVDFSHIKPAEGKKMCASVTINVNSIRSKGSDGQNGSAIAWYYQDGTWTQTTNINACRLEIPDNFKGWIYVPATSFTQTDGEYWDTATERFNDKFFVENMRCYTDGYTYDADSYVIFDEITFIK